MEGALSPWCYCLFSLGGNAALLLWLRFSQPAMFRPIQETNVSFRLHESLQA